MNMPYINISERDLGYSKDGKKLTMLGHIYGYENRNGICVLMVEMDGQKDLAFMELNSMKDNVNQISNGEDIAALKELWQTTQIVDGIAEKLRLNKI